MREGRGECQVSKCWIRKWVIWSKLRHHMCKVTTDTNIVLRQREQTKWMKLLIRRSNTVLRYPKSSFHSDDTCSPKGNREMGVRFANSGMLNTGLGARKIIAVGCEIQLPNRRYNSDLPGVMSNHIRYLMPCRWAHGKDQVAEGLQLPNSCRSWPG